uniref:non-specific serine/threonine protein kinase n=1 Tax=Noctiluca scintillans TaxID=2966 RepID=A0A7S1AH39_NOCSC|mmetsp:Transcript_46066/g.122129  ORF Transcript_46066/g.122129 Transcript_46066/m.122129 type:complete len:322 (+) Transcript_46066:83-1048(+)
MHRYEVHRRLGRGAGGDSLLAEGSEGKCVLKCVQLAGLPRESCRRALREVHVLRRLTHPNVLRILTAFLHHQHLIVVSEYCDAGDLEGLILQRSELAGRQASGGFSEASVLGVFVQLAQALRHIHAQGVVHRDLKPSNVFLTSRGVAKIGDFGVSNSQSFDITGAEGGQANVMGSIRYWSPEACDGEVATAASDCWALGVILYEMCTLETPFPGSNTLTVVIRIIEGRPRELPLTHAGLRDVCRGLLQVTPRFRMTADDVLTLPLVRGVQKQPNMDQRPEMPPVSERQLLNHLELARPFALLLGPAEFERFITRQLAEKEV